jgi:hypothetical protein
MRQRRRRPGKRLQTSVFRMIDAMRSFSVNAPVPHVAKREHGFWGEGALLLTLAHVMCAS